MGRGMNLGQDSKLSIFGTDGSKISFSTIGADLISFSPKPKTNVVRRNSTSTTFESRVVEHMGYEGTFVVGRLNADFDKFAIQAADRYHNRQDEVRYTINEQLQNRDGSGSVSSFRYTNCSIWCEDLGNRAMGDDIKLTFHFEGDELKQDA